MALYDNGASFQTTVAKKGKLTVTDRSLVDNLNAEMLDGAHKSDFVKQGTVDNVDYGVAQTGKNLNLSGVNIVADNTCTFKLGNIIIASAKDGQGVDGNAILICLE